MNEKLQKSLQALQEEVQINKELRAQDRAMLKKIHQDAWEQMQNKHQENREQLIQQTKEAGEQFATTHPKLSIILLTTMQILQNIGV